MYPKSFKSLIGHLSSLPSIGPKMAERLTLHLFRRSPDEIADFADALRSIAALRACRRCFHIAEESYCGICLDQRRDSSIICVVEEPMDVIALERAGNFHGRYHVLGGTLDISPKKSSDGSDVLRITELLRRIPEESIKEIIIATNPTTEGDLTALYLRRKLVSSGVRVTRLGRGLATGGDIEYADDLTLSSALTNRREMS